MHIFKNCIDHMVGASSWLDASGRSGLEFSGSGLEWSGSGSGFDGVAGGGVDVEVAADTRGDEEGVEGTLSSSVSGSSFLDFGAHI